MRTGQIRDELTHDQHHIYAVAFHPDGRRVVTAGADRTARLFRVQADGTVAPEAVLAHEESVRAVAFRPDGRQLATAGDDGKLRLWSLLPYSRRTTLPSRPDGSGEPSYPSNFLAGGIPTGGPESAPTLPEPRLQHEIACPSAVLSIAYRSDGAQLVVGCKDGTARRWSTETGQGLGKALQHSAEWQSLLAVAFSPDGQRLATGSITGQTYLWDARTGQVRHVFQADPGAVRAVAFSPDGRTLATGGEGRAVRFWDLGTGQLRGIPMRHKNHIHVVAFSSDGNTILTSSIDGTARLWRAPPAAPPDLELPTDATSSSAAIDPDRLCALTATESGRVYLWDRAGQALGAPLECGDIIWGTAFDPTGQVFAAGTRGGILRAWKTSTREPLTAPLANGGNVVDVAFSPDGKTLASASREAKAAGVWDLATGRRQLDLKHPEGVTAVRFHPHRPELVTGCNDGKVRFWSLPSGEPTDRVIHHGGYVYSLALSPDGRYLLVGGFANAAARLWDVATCQPIGPAMPHDRHIKTMAFSPDGRLVATGSAKRTQLWLVPSARPVGPPLLHPRGVRAVAFIDGGRTLLSSSGGDLRQRPIAAPMKGSAAQITLWAEATTGMTLDDNSLSLDADVWQQKQSSLAAQAFNVPDFLPGRVGGHANR